MPVEDRLGDVRGEIAEADDPRNIGPADTFPLGKHVAADECRVERARLEEQLDQSRVKVSPRQTGIPAIRASFALIRESRSRRLFFGFCSAGKSDRPDGSRTLPRRRTRTPPRCPNRPQPIYELEAGDGIGSRRAASLPE